MRKILSLCAAFLFAAGVMADPVVLPDTLDVSNVSFRSEGMPDYIITEGDTAGTYFDMGAHDSSNDTLLYAEWDVTIQPIKYTVAVDVYNLNSWRVQLYLLTQAGDTVKSLRYKGSSGQKGQFSIGTLDLTNLAAGNYKVRVHAATAWSKMKLKDVIFAADYQGVSVALPGALQPAYAELSSGASVANGALAFAPSTADAEYATWNVSFAAAGNYLVTLDMTAPNGHNYGVALLSADGATSIASVSEGGQKGDTGIKKLGVIAVPAAGNYKVKLTNATKWSEAVINSIAIAVYVPEYYLVGTMNNWTEAEAYKFAVNPENAAEYMLTTTLAEGDSLKVKSDVNVWFPDNAANYGVDAAHAGEKTVYFRPDGQGGNDWYNGVIYIAPNAEPQPIDPTAPYVLKFNGTGSSSDNSNEFKKDGDIFTDACKMYVASVDTISKVYAARIIEGDTSSLKFGTSSVKGYMEFTLAIPTAVDSIVVDATQYGNNATKISVNGVEFDVNAGNKKAYLCKITPAGIITKITIAQTSSERLYLRSIAVYPSSGETPEPEVKYYMKNNWDAAADWTWKEMTKDGDNYRLDSVVFGGTGVNYNTKAEDAGAVWVELAKIAGAKIAAKDTVSFVLNPADSTVTATLIGKYIAEPVAVAKDFEIDLRGGQLGEGCEKYLVVGETQNEFFDAAPAEYNAYLKAQSFNGGTHGYVLLTAMVPVEAGDYKVTLGKCQYANSDPYTMAYVFNAALTDTLTSCKQNTTQAEEGGVCYHQDTVNNVATMEFTVEAAQIVKIVCAHYTPYIKVERVTPVQHTYTVAGGSDVAFGKTWKPALEANDMTLAEGDSLYRWEKANLTLAAGNIEFKVCEDHAWTNAWPAQNYSLAIAEAGIYTVKITFNPETKAVAAEAIKTGEAIVIPTVAMHGNFTGSWKDTELFTLAADSATATLKLNIAAGNYEFGMRVGGSGNWMANGVQFTRENPAAKIVSGQGNLKLDADQAGEYTFTWFYANDSLAIAYPKIVPHYGVAEAIAAGLADNDLVYVNGIITKMEFKGTNFKKYGSVNIYVKDVNGPDSVLFEFYNCYSMDADTFKTSDPVYDATSTAWAQFNSVADAKGTVVALGDTVEAYGKYKLYNTTHELNTGCYITNIKKYVAPVPMANPIDTVKFFMNGDSWTPDTISKVTWDAENEKVIINIIPAKHAQWQGQLWLKLPMDVRAGYEYDLAFKVKSDKSFEGTIVKYQENAEMLIDWNMALVANEELAYEKKNMRGLANGNGVLVIDFGFAPDSTNIEVYEISIVEHEATAPLAKFYVTGNDAFTADAGLEAGKAWNPDALASYSDTLTVALKAGAAYQLKVCVDGSWNTVKGYNDLTEKAAGLQDADGNNHNIGFSLVADGDVQIIYTAEVYKLIGNFVVEGLDNTNAEVKAIKVLRNGQIFIEMNGKTYNVLGTLVK